MLVKDELQNIISGDEQACGGSVLKRAQIYLGGNEGAGAKHKVQKPIKSEEKELLRKFCEENGLIFNREDLNLNYLSEGAEQKVYRFGNSKVVKFNDGIFYEFWLDYLNSLLIHNYFFPLTAYELLGFEFFDDKIYSVVLQSFVKETEPVNLEIVNEFLEHNGFRKIRNQDFINEDLGLILEDIHDENVIFENGIPFFIDTVFYPTENFYQK